MTAAPRACFFLGNYRPEAFGIGRYVPYYVDALAAAGWTAEVFAPYPFYPTWRLDRSLPAESSEAGRVRVSRYAPFVPRRPTGGLRILHDLSLGWHAVRLLGLRAGPADLFVAASPPLLGAAVTVQLARWRRRPSIVLAYDLVADLAGEAGSAGGSSVRALRATEKRVYAGATEVIALTDGMARRIEALTGRAEPVSVLRIWADENLFQLDLAQAGAAFRVEQGIDPAAYLIGFAGNFGRKQQLVGIANAASGLPAAYHTVFVGDGPERTELERLAAASAGRIRVLPPQSEPGLHAFLAACDASIVVAWTQRAGTLFPSKAANVLAAGCPIVAVTPRDGDLGRLIESEALGVVCPSLAPDELRAAMTRAAELGRSPEQRERCRAYALRYLRRDSVTDRFVAWANRLVARDRP